MTIKIQYDSIQRQNLTYFTVPCYLTTHWSKSVHAVTANIKRFSLQAHTFSQKIAEKWGPHPNSISYIPKQLKNLI